MHFIYDLAEHKEVGTEMRWFPRKATLLTEKEKKKKKAVSSNSNFLAILSVVLEA